MQIITLILLGVGLSMDAFAVAVCKGLAMKKADFRAALVVGLWFGGFQALMPLAGYFLGAQFHSYIENFDHWIAAILLALIGINMIREALDKGEEKSDASLGFRTMFVMAIATSIDALAVGIALAMEESTNIWLSIGIIGTTTFILSAIGLKVGNLFGTRFRSKAEFAGGLILILLGIKILLEHLGVLSLPF